MRFSLRALIVTVTLAALLTSGLLINNQLNGLKAKGKQIESETDNLNFQLSDFESIKKNFNRYSESFEKQRDEIMIANEKYLELASNMRPLKVVDGTNKLSVIQIPDTSWANTGMKRIGWRVFVPEPEAGFTNSHLAIDFLSSYQAVAAGEIFPARQDFENAKILKKSKNFAAVVMMRERSATSQTFELPAGESKVYFESQLYYRSNGSGKRVKRVRVRILVNETCVYKMNLRVGRFMGNGSVLAGEFLTDSVHRRLPARVQPSFDADAPIKLFVYSPANHFEECCWLRIVPPQLSDAEVAK